MLKQKPIYTKYLDIDNLQYFIQLSLVFICIYIETYIEDIIFTQCLVIGYIQYVIPFSVHILLGCITYMGYHRTQRKVLYLSP